MKSHVWMFLFFAAAVCLRAQAPDAAGGATEAAPLEAALDRHGKRDTRLHDPSTIVKCNGEYWLFATGPGVSSWRSKDLMQWERGPRVFDPPPAWITNVVAGHRGYFWAPDIIHHNGRYWLYYSVSKFGVNTSAIGFASNPTLDPSDPTFGWTDHGIAVESAREDTFNAIDPALTKTPGGRLWLSFGSFWSGIKLVELDPVTGKRAADSPMHGLAQAEEIEAPFIYRHGNYYYLFVNWGICCRGTNSTYNIRVGRSREITGPYLDKEGKDLAEGGGTLLLGTDGAFIGPGHASIFEEDGKSRFSCHFYDGTRRGRPMLAIQSLHWEAGGWPVLAAATGRAEDSFPVRIRVDAAATRGELKPIWRFFGADEPNYAYMKHGKKLLAELGALRPNQVYFRAHSLLTSGDGTPALKWGSTGAYSEDSEGRPIYDWTILDRIFDSYLERGVRPYAQIGFMPKALSIQPEPYQHRWTPRARYDEIYTGWAYPPKDYDKWRELVFQWVKHCVERYGREEVETWYWQTWNEANIGYWRGTPREFHKLHDYAIDGVRRAFPRARVGGPDTAGHGGRFMREFLEHCLRGTNYATGGIGTPLDFVSFHAKGAPRHVGGHVQMGMAAQLRTIEEGVRLVASYPELKEKPIIIGECDPEGCAACQGPQLAYRNGTMYSSYTAASFARIYELAVKHRVNLEGALTWAFEFEDQPYFAGFRSLASNGIDKPVLNVFRMFSKMAGQRLAAESDGAVPLDEIVRSGVREQADVAAMACLDGNSLAVLVWHYHDNDVPGPEAEIELALRSFPFANGKARLEHFRIDEEHSNAFEAWKQMGSPQQPTSEQYARLEKAARLATLGAPENVAVNNREATLRFKLPRQAVSLLMLTWQVVP